MRLKDETGGYLWSSKLATAVPGASWREILEFFLETRVRYKSEEIADLRLAELAAAPLWERAHAVRIQLSDSKRVWNWALSW